MFRLPYDAIDALTVMLSAQADARSPIRVSGLQTQLERVIHDARLNSSLTGVIGIFPDYAGGMPLEEALSVLRAEGSVKIVNGHCSDDLMPLLALRAEALRRRIPAHHYDALRDIGQRIYPRKQQR